MRERARGNEQGKRWCPFSWPCCRQTNIENEDDVALVLAYKFLRNPLHAHPLHARGSVVQEIAEERVRVDANVPSSKANPRPKYREAPRRPWRGIADTTCARLFRSALTHGVVEEIVEERVRVEARLPRVIHVCSQCACWCGCLGCASSTVPCLRFSKGAHCLWYWPPGCVDPRRRQARGLRGGTKSFASCARTEAP